MEYLILVKEGQRRKKAREKSLDSIYPHYLRVNCLLSSAFELLEILKSTTRIELWVAWMSASWSSLVLIFYFAEQRLSFLILALFKLSSDLLSCLTVFLDDEWMKKRWIWKTTGNRTILYRARGKLCETLLPFTMHASTLI